MGLSSPAEALAFVEQVSKAALIASALGAALFAWAARIFYQWHRLSHVPGPFWAAFSKYWMVKESLKGRQPTAFKEVTDKYGAWLI